MLSPSSRALFLFGASGSLPVFAGGRWWTILSAGWLHGGAAAHLLQHDGAASARAGHRGSVRAWPHGHHLHRERRGRLRVSARSREPIIPPLPFLAGGQFTVGASASIAGLIGAVLAYGQRSGSTLARSYATQYAVMLVIIGVLMPGIDNYAHMGGFGGGYLVARFLDPLKPERIDHVAIALLCLGVSLVSVIVSVVHGVQFLQ